MIQNRSRLFVQTAAGFAARFRVVVRTRTEAVAIDRSARDPVNVAGSVAENILDGLVRTVSWERLESGGKADRTLLDVREPSEYRGLEGALNTPLPLVRDRPCELDPRRETLVYCAVGLRAYVACRILAQRGFDRVSNLSGGWKTWEAVATRTGATTPVGSGA